MTHDSDFGERLVRVEERTKVILDEVEGMRADMLPLLGFVRTRLVVERTIIGAAIVVTKVAAVVGVIFVAANFIWH